jgi:hypothetical protein
LTLPVSAVVVFNDIPFPRIGHPWSLAKDDRRYHSSSRVQQQVYVLSVKESEAVRPGDQRGSMGLPFETFAF